MNYYFITGTSSGIGKALVLELLNLPEHQIFGISRTNHLQEDSFEHHVLDLSKSEEVKAFNFQNLRDAKKIVLVNNAGTLGEIKYIGQQSNENIQDAMQVNFTSPAILMNNFIAAYQGVSCEKLIVNITSGAASSAYDGWSNYCSAKAALNMFTEVIVKEQENQKHPVEAYAIAPGVVDTFMQEQIRSTAKDQFSQISKFKDLKQNDELYQAQDVAKRLVSLMSEPEKISSRISRIRLE